MSTSRHIQLALAAFLVVGCDTAEQTTAPDLVALSSPSFAVARAPICHRRAGGDYVRIDIAQSAYDTHIAHGDQPAGSGGLDANCQPQPCPCFSAASVAEEIATWDGLHLDDYAVHLWTVLSENIQYEKYFYAYHDGVAFYSCGTQLLSVQNITQLECEACRSILLEFAP